MSAKPRTSGPKAGGIKRDDKGRIVPGSAAIHPGGRPKVPEDIREALTVMAPRAVERLRQLLESADEDIAYKAAVHVLDRNLGMAVQPIKDVTDMTDDQIRAELKRMAREILTEDEEAPTHAAH